MKTLYLTTIFSLICISIFGQRKPIESYIFSARNLNYSGCVEDIRVKSYHFYSIKEKKHTIYKEYLAQFENGKVKKRLRFSKNDTIPSQINSYDSLGRITSLKRKNYRNKKFEIQQSFSNESQFPDSTNFYFNKVKNESYVNTFIDTLVIKQEHYQRDTLKTFTTFKYDDKNRLVEKISVNTENGFGITIGKSITGSEDTKTLYPNDTIKFEYKSIGDTLIRKKYKEGELDKILRTVNNGRVNTEIIEDYFWGYYSSKKVTEKYKEKDSTVFKSYNFNRQKDTTSVLTEVRTPHRTNSIWDRGDWKSTSEYRIETKHDGQGNWIEKKRFYNGELEDYIIREINYCR